MVPNRNKTSLLDENRFLLRSLTSVTFCRGIECFWTGKSVQDFLFGAAHFAVNFASSPSHVLFYSFFKKSLHCFDGKNHRDFRIFEFFEFECWNFCDEKTKQTFSILKESEFAGGSFEKKRKEAAEPLREGEWRWKFHYFITAELLSHFQYRIEAEKWNSE